MARRARGRLGDAVRAVCAVAGIAALSHLAVRRLGLHRVAGGATNVAERSAVSLMTAAAVLVRGRRGRVLLNVTGAACGRNFAGMRLVTARTFAVPRRDLRFLRGVTGLAAHLERRRTMR